jgi:hypothetical protein
MKLCVVGNGSSARGQGTIIDACDFVVRIKAWWQNGAADSGSRCDALAHYGWGGGGLTEFTREHWITQTVDQVQGHDDGWGRLGYVNRVANHRPIRWLTKQAWLSLETHLGSHPSTGIVAVAMALSVMKPTELVVYGFDSTTPGKPNFADARGNVLSEEYLAAPAHDHLAEKRAMADLLNGTWLGEPSGVKLTWPDMPELT